MSTDSLLPPVTNDCMRFEAQLGAWLERDLDPAAQTFMTRHRASCPLCGALATEIEGVVAQAAALAPLTAPPELWRGIEARLETAVVPLPVTSSAAGTVPRAPRTIGIRTFAIAATVLVAVSSGVTWRLANTRGATPSVSATAPDLPVSPVVNRDDELTAPAVTYEREIDALRRIVDERFAELDSATVSELRRNLSIIDTAIADSRTALARDPRSAIVSTQLDRALEAKLDLLRRVALL